VFEFDFATADARPARKELPVAVVSEGTAGAIVFWFDLQLDATLELSNRPGADAPLHWKQGLQFLPELRVRAGTTVPLLAEHDGSGLSFGWKVEALDKDSLSALPRFDARWLQHGQDLERQTRGLMQHCLQHPEEYRKAADVAQRFAADPAAHDIDPAIASRFAAMFFSA